MSESLRTVSTWQPSFSNVFARVRSVLEVEKERAPEFTAIGAPVQSLEAVVKP